MNGSVDRVALKPNSYHKFIDYYEAAAMATKVPPSSPWDDEREVKRLFKALVLAGKAKKKEVLSNQ